MGKLRKRLYLRTKTFAERFGRRTGTGWQQETERRFAITLDTLKNHKESLDLYRWVAGVVGKHSDLIDRLADVSADTAAGLRSLTGTVRDLTDTVEDISSGLRDLVGTVRTWIKAP